VVMVYKCSTNRRRRFLERRLRRSPASAHRADMVEPPPL
jgi:hypothetical protein